MLAEEGHRRLLDAVELSAEGHLVEIDFEHLVFGQGAVHLEREYPLFELARDGFVRRQHGKLDHLLGDGRAALAGEQVALAGVGEYGAQYRRGLDPGVRVVPGVLHRHHRLRDQGRNVGQRHHRALHFVVEVVQQDLARAVEYFDRLLAPAGLQRGEVGELERRRPQKEEAAQQEPGAHTPQKQPPPVAGGIARGADKKAVALGKHAAQCPAGRQDKLVHG